MSVGSAIVSLADPGDFQDREHEQQKLQRDSVTPDRELRDLRWLMSGPRGRAVVWDVLVACSVFVQEIGSSASAMAAYEGGRSLGMRWFEAIHWHPDLFRFYPAMVNENLHDDRDRSEADADNSH